MEQDSDEPVFWAVAGCLFEISLQSRPGASPWRVTPGPEVTLLSESACGDGQRFRFRAETAGVAGGRTHVRFRSMTAAQAVVMRTVTVAIAPEHTAPEIEPEAQQH